MEKIMCDNAIHDTDGCLGYSNEPDGYGYCDECINCPEASINKAEEEDDLYIGEKGKQRTFHIPSTDITFYEEIDLEEAERRFGYAMNNIGVKSVRGGIMG